jgi:L-ascorbate metabolism protein UlaG (beta-lactamase superfamily)
MIEPLQSDDALLADIESVASAATRLDVSWLGQSAFLCKSANVTLLFDPYLSDALTKKYASTDNPHVRMSRLVIEPSRLSNVDYITSTHGHTDHLDAVTLNPLFAANPKATLIYACSTKPLVEQRVTNKLAALIGLSSGERWTTGGFAIDVTPASHKPAGKDVAGDDHCVGFAVHMGPFTIYHSGYGVVHPGLVDGVKAHGPIDLAILPINGKVGNMDGADAARLAKDIGAKLVVPCHYHMFEFNTAEPSEKFIPECERLGQPYKVLQLGERLTLEKP